MVKRRPIVALTLALAGTTMIAAAVFGLALAHSSPPRAVKDPPVPVVAGIATRANVPKLITALGTVQPVQTVAVQSRVSGEIIQVLFTPGQEVKQGQPLFQIDPRPYRTALQQAEGQLAKDKALLAQAKADLARYQRLVKENSISQQQAADQAFLVRQDNGTVEVDEANVANARLNLSYARVDAPAAGLTGPLLVDRGNDVQAGAGTTLVTITQMKPIYVNFAIPEAGLAAVRHYQALAPLEVEAFSEAGKPLAVGRLTLIDNQVNTATGTVMLEATFANADQALWPGASVSARLVVHIRKNVTTVPDRTVMVGPSGPYVYVIRPNDTVERVAVKVAARQSGIDVIASGLEPGERVVTEGQYRLANHVKVAIRAKKPASQAAKSETTGS